MGEFLWRQSYSKSYPLTLPTGHLQKGWATGNKRESEDQGAGNSQQKLLPPPSSSSSVGDGDELAPPPGPLNYRRKPVSLGSCSSVSGPVLSLPPCLFLLPAFIPYLSSLSFIANYTSLTLLSSHHRLSGQHLNDNKVFNLFLCILQTPLQTVVVDLTGDKNTQAQTV